MTDPKLTIGNPSLLNNFTKNDEIKKMKYKTEKHDYGKILRSLKLIVKFIKRNIIL